MKPYFSEEIDLSTNSNNHAAQKNQQQPMVPKSGPRTDEPPGQRQATPLGDFAAVVALSIAFFTLLLLSLRITPPPAVAQTFELSPRPIWISTVPYAPRDGLVPDFGQSESGRGQRVVK
jgi:hypothetical protein